MPTDDNAPKDADLPAANLPAAAQRALDEAAARRKLADAAEAMPTELGGRSGPEPVR